MQLADQITEQRNRLTLHQIHDLAVIDEDGECTVCKRMRLELERLYKESTVSSASATDQATDTDTSSAG